jgi:hypothetical protein
VADQRAYLDLVAQQLPFSEAVRQEVVEEIGAHLDDVRAELVDGGSTESDAMSQAIARLGPPAELARDITRAHQTPRRLLSAVGWGVVTTSRFAVAGWIVTAAILAAAIGGMVLLGVAWSIAGLGPLAAEVFVAVALYLAGRRLPGLIADHGHRSVAWSGLATAIMGLAILTPLVLLLPVSHTPASVAAMLAIPAVFVIGVRSGQHDASTGGGRWDLRVPMVAAAVIVVAMLSLPVTSEVDGRLFTRSVAMPGLESVGPIDAVAADAAATGSTCCPATLEAGFSDRDVLAGYTDLRFEVWPAAGTEMAIEPGLGPLLIVPARPAMPADRFKDLLGVTLDGTSDDTVLFDAPLRWTGSRQDLPTYAVVTGKAVGGRRFVLAAPSFQVLQFDGGAVEWILAPRSALTYPTETTAPLPAASQGE